MADANGFSYDQLAVSDPPQPPGPVSLTGWRISEPSPCAGRQGDMAVRDIRLGQLRCSATKAHLLFLAEVTP